MTTIRYCLHCGAVYRTSYQRCPLDGHQLVEGVAEPLIGQVLDGRYRIQSCVGHGAMGRVYRAQHVRMGRAFAVKVMYGDFAADPDMRARFMREAEAASRLDHPNVVAAVDVGATEGGIPYLVMEFLEGQTLKRWVDTAGPLTEADMTWIGISVSRGLAHAHLRGLVHRDLKPENIFVVDIDGRRLAKIVDFGIAFLADHGTNARLTQTGHIMGTPYFMPPEQCSGQRVDARADIFSLGLCLFYGMVGRPPFSGDAAQVIHRIVSSAVPPLDSVIPPDRVSTQFSRVVAKMTAHDREHRYQTAEACIAALEGRDPSDIPAPGRAPKRTEIDPTDISDMGIPGPGSEPSFLPAPPPRAPVARGVGRFLIPVVIGLAIGMVAFAGRFLVTAQAPADAELEPAPLVDSSPEPVEDAPPEEAPTAAPPPILTAQPTPKVDPTPEPPPAARSGKGRGRRGRTRRTSGASGATAAAKGRKTGASKAPSTKAPSTKAPSTKAPVAAQTPAPEVEAASAPEGTPAKDAGARATPPPPPAPAPKDEASTTASPEASEKVAGPAESSAEAGPKSKDSAAGEAPAAPEATPAEPAEPTEDVSPKVAAPPSEAPSKEDTTPGEKETPEPPPAEAPSSGVAPAQFNALYARVGKRLTALAADKGGAAAAELLARYAAVDKGKALTDDAARAAAYAELEDIQLDVAAAALD